MCMCMCLNKYMYDLYSIAYGVMRLIHRKVGRKRKKEREREREGERELVCCII